LGEILSEREAIANELETTLDAATDPWGIKVSILYYCSSWVSQTSILYLASPVLLGKCQMVSV